MIGQLQDLGYTVGWAQGPTPPEVREEHRRNGWAWEGDTHVEHHVHVKHVDGEPITGAVPIQHFDAEAAGYVPEHRVLRDDSDETTIWVVEGPSGYDERADGTPIGPMLRVYVNGDDEDLIQAIVDGHDDLVAELELRVTETAEETAARHQREAEERAAEES